MDKYELIKYLDKGAFSECNLYSYRQNKFVIKSPLEKTLCYNELREILALKILNNHNNIIYLLDIIPSDTNGLNLVYKYYSLTLFEFIDKTEINYRLKFTESFIKQLFSAVHYLHSNNIIHTDLKSSNILIKFDNYDKIKIKIIDFGSCYIDGLTEKNSIVSTYTVRAPEVYRYDCDYDNKIDVWSMGVVIFRYITNFYILHPKIHNESCDISKLNYIYYFLENDMNKVITNDNVKFLLQKMLVNDPNKRYNINKIIKLFEEIYDVKVPIQSCENINLNIKINEKLSNFNSYFIQFTKINFTNIIVGSNILNKIKNYTDIDIICSWYLNYLVTHKDIRFFMNNLIKICNKYFNSTYHENDILLNCIEILKKINFTLI